MTSTFKVFAFTLAMFAGANAGLAVAQTTDVVPLAPKFSGGPTYQVDATSMDVVIADTPSTEYPQVGHLAPTTYAQAVREWAAVRFNLTGNSVNRLRVTLKDGHIVESVLPIKKGIAGWFKKEQSVQYDATLSVDVAVVDVGGTVLASAQAKAVQSRTLLEGATPADKRKAWADMVQSTFDNLDATLAEQIRTNLGSYAR